MGDKDRTPEDTAADVRAAIAGTTDKAEGRGYDPDDKLSSDTASQREAYDAAYSETEEND